MRFGILATCGVFPCAELTGQTLSLQEQLKAEYKLVKTGSDAYGLTVVDPGTVLDVQKGGLMGGLRRTRLYARRSFRITTSRIQTDFARRW